VCTASGGQELLASIKNSGAAKNCMLQNCPTALDGKPHAGAMRVGELPAEVKSYVSIF
jgi:hypothetical protein